jgi:oxygen-independent coproporphyrinogen-3 oxidase
VNKDRRKMKNRAMRYEHLYIHIPFCRSKCHYCDFISYPAAEFKAAINDYGRLLLAEAALWREQARLGPWQSIYIGGGTPSLLPAEDIAALLGDLLAPQNEEAPEITAGRAGPRIPALAGEDKAVSIPEITLEANPDSVTTEKLFAWRAAQVNRLSLGAQSFDDALLTAMGRPHNAAQISEAVHKARLAGFENISIDLIYGLPGQDVNAWRADLARALELEVEHISLYGLSLSEQSPWGREVAAGRLSVADEDTSADMLEAALELLPQAGYIHYEISNFARRGFASRHNTAYWRREDYLGLGAAAASCRGEKRWFNERGPAAYGVALKEGRLPLIEQETLSIEEVLGEALFLGLRLSKGVDLDYFARRYGTRAERYYKKPLHRLQRQGLVEISDGHLRLTRRGLLLGNEVFMQFL